MIEVNITCMMVLASVYISVSSSLPLMAGLKYVEIWLLFNLAYPVMVIIVNIFLQVNEQRNIYILVRQLISKQTVPPSTSIQGGGCTVQMDQILVHRYSNYSVSFFVKALI